MNTVPSLRRAEHQAACTAPALSLLQKDVPRERGLWADLASQRGYF